MSPSFNVNPISIFRSTSLPLHTNDNYQPSTKSPKSRPKSPTIKLPRSTSFRNKKNTSSPNRFLKLTPNALPQISILRSSNKHSSPISQTFNNNNNINNSEDQKQTMNTDSTKPKHTASAPISSNPLSALSPILPRSLKSNSNSNNNTTTTTTSSSSPPPHLAEELLFLSHGMQGTVEDFNYLLDSLKETTAAKSGRLIIYASRANTDKTQDGIVLGGLRLAEDIRSVIQSYPTASKISLMGFSLGGMYIRFAAARLYDPKTKLIGGLKGNSIIVVASPNLGVRKFGVYRFIPFGLQGAGTLLFGETARQLLLQDDEQIVKQMSTDSEQHGCQYLSALKAFEHRSLYANLRNDFMVNYGTAALDSSVQVLNGSEVDALEDKHKEFQVDEEHDEKGCRICFEFKYDEQALTEMETEEGLRKMAMEQKNNQKLDNEISSNIIDREKNQKSKVDDDVEETKCINKLERTIISKNQGNDTNGNGNGFLGLRSNDDDKKLIDDDEEHRMCERLQKVGWRVIGIDFPMAMPIAHNRIVAMSRNVIHKWVNFAGRRVVHHLVDTVVGKDGNGEEKYFEPVGSSCVEK